MRIGIVFFAGLLGQWSFLERFAPPDAMLVKKRSLPTFKYAHLLTFPSRSTCTLAKYAAFTIPKISVVRAKHFAKMQVNLLGKVSR